MRTLSPHIQNLPYVEKVYAGGRHDPDSVSKEWRKRLADSGEEDAEYEVQLSPSFKPRSIFNPAGNNLKPRPSVGLNPQTANLSERIYQLVHNHRVRGHIIAAVDPLGALRPCPAELKLDFYGFTAAELDLLVNLPTLHSETPLTIREIFQRLRETYCRSIGVQYMHIDDLVTRQWLERRIESQQNRVRLTRNEQLRILTCLTDAVVFEEFLRKKFLGDKTFSLESCETLIPLLDRAIEKAGRLGVKNIVIGMGHRGRLNVLAHVAGKSTCDIFREFADLEPGLWRGRGDVKYHLGHSGDWLTESGRKTP